MKWGSGTTTVNTPVGIHGRYGETIFTILHNCYLNKPIGLFFQEPFFCATTDLLMNRVVFHPGIEKQKIHKKSASTTR